MSPLTVCTLAFIGVTTINIACFAQSSGPQAGDPAPPITIEHLSNTEPGAQATWEALSDQTVVVEFWGTWCAPCVAAIPHLNDLAEELQDEDFTFLSVTFEDQPIIEKFLARRPMKSWIGHDLDRSMVKAYGVAGWPTTFVVRNGVVAARTTPGALTAELLREYKAGRVDQPTETVEVAERTDQVGPDGRPLFTQMRPGVDPLSTYQEVPTFHCLIRDAGDASALHVALPFGFTLMGQPIRSIVAWLWNVPSYTVVGSELIDQQSYDVIVRVPHEREAFYLPLVRQIVAETLGLEVHEETGQVNGYELHVDPAGLLMEAGLSERGGHSVGSDGQTVSITGASLKVETLIGCISQNAVNAPIRNETSLEGTFFVEISLPSNDVPAAIDSLREQTGLLLVPAQIEMPVLRVQVRPTEKPRDAASQ